MVLLLETAALLEARARRSGDPTQVGVLMRRAEQRRRQATELRERLAARGTAMARALPGFARRHRTDGLGSRTGRLPAV